MKKKNDKERFTKVSLIMEKFWLVLAVGSLCVVIYFFITYGVSRQNLQYLIFPALAGLMYGFRLAFRKRFEKDSDQ